MKELAVATIAGLLVIICILAGRISGQACQIDILSRDRVVREIEQETILGDCYSVRDTCLMANERCASTMHWTVMQQDGCRRFLRLP